MPVLSICGELFSDNLGDGVIAGCLAHLVRRQHPDLEVRHLDLSIKEGYGQTVLPVIRPRTTLSGFRARFFQATPLLVKQVIKRVWFRRRVEPMMRSFFRRRLTGADVLMIGGGQLLMDNGLHFPLKIRALVRAAHEVGIERIFFFGCGARPKWSAMGRRIMRQAFEGDDIIEIVTRDRESPENLRTNFPGLRTPISVGGDSALRVHEPLSRAHPELSDTRILPRAHEPAALIGHVARCRAIVACRLHAAVIACALSVPGIGIICITKTVQFGRHTARSKFFVEPQDLDAGHIHKLLDEAMAVGVPAEHQAKVKAAVVDSLHTVLVRSGLLPPAAR